MEFRKGVLFMQTPVIRWTTYISDRENDHMHLILKSNMQRVFCFVFLLSLPSSFKPFKPEAPELPDELWLSVRPWESETCALKSVTKACESGGGGTQLTKIRRTGGRRC